MRRIDECKVFFTKGPWETKSGGELNVLFSMPLSEILSEFLAYEIVPTPDIRGLRFYTVSNLSKGAVGGGEFHKIRKEIIIPLSGSVKWIVMDNDGNRIQEILKPGNGMLMPPYIMHDYEVLEDNTTLLIFCNTLFFPEIPESHDTFGRSEFY